MTHRRYCQLEAKVGNVLFTVWFIFLVWTAWAGRYWINNDTIGSLDSARLIRAGSIGDALNGIWGTSYAFFLAPFIHDNMQSWLMPHLLLTGCVLGTQALIYRVMRHLEVQRYPAIALVLAWGASCYLTLGALYGTADTPFALIIAFLTWWIVCHHDSTKSGRFGAITAIFHIVAGFTKTIGLFGLITVPICLIICRRNDRIKMMIAYGVTAALLLGAWAMWSINQYGRVTWGDTGAYNYALYVNESADLERASTRSGAQLPTRSTTTFWWSDPSTTLENEWDWATTFDAVGHVRMVRDNLVHLLTWRGFIQASTSLCLLIGGVIALLRSKGAHRHLPIWLPVCAVGLMGLYLITHFTARFLPAVTILALPAWAYWLKKTERTFAIVLLLGMYIGSLLVAGFVVMQNAPNDAHFVTAAQFSAGDQIAVWESSKSLPYHGGIVAHIVHAQSANLLFDDATGRYTATFTPDHLLFATLPQDAPLSAEIVINMIDVTADQWTITGQNTFVKTKETRWHGRGEHILTTYSPATP